jgi:excisionase family DNA binding protein
MNRQQQNPVHQAATRRAHISPKVGPAPTPRKPETDECPLTETKADDAIAHPVQKRQRQRPETRAQLLERLLNPQISLHEAAILLRVCPATVRNYTKSGLLPHVRTAGRQRRFSLRDVLVLLRQLDGARK